MISLTELAYLYLVVESVREEEGESDGGGEDTAEEDDGLEDLEGTCLGAFTG